MVAVSKLAIHCDSAEIRIIHIKRAGSAAAHPRIKRGLAITSINGVSIVGWQKQVVLSTLRACENEVALTFEADVAGFEAYAEKHGLNTPHVQHFLRC
jgi:hypothetical protein